MVELLVDDARDRITALGGVEPHAAYGQPAEELPRSLPACGGEPRPPGQATTINAAEGHRERRSRAGLRRAPQQRCLADPPAEAGGPAGAPGGSGGGRRDADRLLLALLGERDRHLDDAVVRLCLDLLGIDA
jgi:hypothetical protein